MNSIEVEGSPREVVLYFHSARSTSTTDLKANHSGISSPARSIWRNLVPESFLGLAPDSLAASAHLARPSVATPACQNRSFERSFSGTRGTRDGDEATKHQTSNAWDVERRRLACIRR